MADQQPCRLGTPRDHYRPPAHRESPREIRVGAEELPSDEAIRAETASGAIAVNGVPGVVFQSSVIRIFRNLTSALGS
jgi:hypothetical protein